MIILLLLLLLMMINDDYFSPKTSPSDLWHEFQGVIEMWGESNSHSILLWVSFKLNHL